MTDQTKTGDVGAGVCAHLHHDFFSIFIKGCHCFYHLVVSFLIQKLRLVCCGQYANSQRLGQNKQVAFLAVAVLHYFVRVHKTSNTQPILRFRVLNGVAARNNGTCFLYFVRTALHDFCHDVHWQTGWEADQIHRDAWIAAHRIDIAQGVCSSNLTKGVWIIYNRWEKVYSLYNCEVIPYLVDQRVVAGVKSNNQFFIGKFR